MKKYLLISIISCFSVTLTSNALADSIRLPDGTSCSFDTYNSPWELEFGSSVRDVQNEYKDNPFYSSKPNSEVDDVALNASITYKFGGPERLNCGRLYELQIRIKEAELKTMELQLKQLEEAAEIDWDE